MTTTPQEDLKTSIEARDGGVESMRLLEVDPRKCPRCGNDRRKKRGAITGEFYYCKPCNRRS